MIKSKGYFTIYLLTSIFRLPKGKAICVTRYSEFNSGIAFKMSFPDSYGKGKDSFADSYGEGKDFEFFIPWHNVDYIESNV